MGLGCPQLGGSGFPSGHSSILFTLSRSPACAPPDQPPSPRLPSRPSTATLVDKGTYRRRHSTAATRLGGAHTRLGASCFETLRPHRLQQVHSFRPILPQLPPLEELELLVQRAIDESETEHYSWWDLRHSIFGSGSGINVAAGIHLREYFGSYLDRVGYLIRRVPSSQISAASELVNRFFVETALNHILDAPWASYLISDYIETVDHLVRTRGGVIERLEPHRAFLSEAWREPASSFEGVTKADLDRIRSHQLGSA